MLLVHRLDHICCPYFSYCYPSTPHFIQFISDISTMDSERRFEYLTQKFGKDKLQVLLTSNGKPNVQLIRQIFHGIDKNKDGYISPAELRVWIIGIKLEDDGFIRGDYADKVKEAFDISGDSNINEEEFVAGLSKYLLNAQKPAFHHVQKVPNTNTDEGQSLLVKGNSAPSAKDPWKNYIKAAYLILLGTAISVLHCHSYNL